MDDTPKEEIYLTVIGETTFLCIKDKHMWPVSTIQYINLTKGKNEIHVIFAGNQTWTFAGASADTFRAILNKSRNEVESINRRTASL